MQAVIAMGKAGDIVTPVIANSQSAFGAEQNWTASSGRLISSSGISILN